MIFGREMTVGILTLRKMMNRRMKMNDGEIICHGGILSREFVMEQESSNKM